MVGLADLNFGLVIFYWLVAPGLVSFPGIFQPLSGCSEAPLQHCFSKNFKSNILLWTIFSKKEKFISWWQPKECKFYNNSTCQLVNNTEEIRIAAHVNVYMCWMFYFNFSVFHIILHYLRLQIFKRFVVVIIIDCPRNDWQNFTKKSCHLLMIDVNLVLNIVLLTRTSTNTLLKNKRVFLRALTF